MGQWLLEEFRSPYEFPGLKKEFRDPYEFPSVAPPGLMEERLPYCFVALHRAPRRTQEGLGGARRAGGPMRTEGEPERPMKTQEDPRGPRRTQEDP